MDIPDTSGELWLIFDRVVAENDCFDAFRVHLGRFLTIL